MGGLHRKLRFGACLILVTLATGAIAWFSAYSSISRLDDEGTLMQSVQRFLDGRVLYDDLLSIYGPLYYAYESLPHALTGAPISHDSVRLVSVIFWTAAALVLFLLVYQATGSLALALAAHFAGFWALDFIGVEPAHPQELCIVLLLGVGLATCARRPVCMAWLGGLAGAIVLTKLNLGLLVVSALLMVFALALPRGGLRKVLTPAATVGVIAVPLVLMAAQLTQGWAIRYAGLIVISLVSVILVASRNKIEPLPIRDLAIASLAALVSLTLIASFVLVHGSTVPGMIRSLLIWPRNHFAQNWFMPFQVRRAAMAWAAVCLPAAWFASRRSLPLPAIMALKLTLAAITAIFAGSSSYRDLLVFATPMAWLILVAPRPSTADRSGLLRPVLAVTGVLQVLYAYPVAGAQVAFATVIMLAIAAICFWDALPWLGGLLQSTGQRAAVAAAGRIVATSLSLLVLIAYGFMARNAIRKYQAFEPLALPGANHLRVAPDLAIPFRRLRIAAQPCSMMVTEPGLFSINLFTGKPAPHSLRSGPWMLLMSDAEQAITTREIEAQPAACVVHNPDLVKAWTIWNEPPQGPLTLFIRDNFRTEFEVGGYRFMVRK